MHSAYVIIPVENRGCEPVSTMQCRRRPLAKCRMSDFDVELLVSKALSFAVPGTGDL